MSPVLSHQLVEIVDARAATRTRPHAGAEALDRCRVESWGLQTTTLTPDDPFVLAETCWLVPAHGLRLRQRRSREGGDTTTEIGAVRVDVDGTSWHCTDLVLGLEIVPGRPARVVHDADFAAAVAGGVLAPADADEAMSTVHRVLGELAATRHDLDRWTAELGIGPLTRS